MEYSLVLEFSNTDPVQTAEAIVLATHHFKDPSVVAEASAMIGEPMPGLEIETLDVRLEERGWWLKLYLVWCLIFASLIFLP